MIGATLKWLINVWIAVTGKKYTYTEYPWLKGPMGDDSEIGDAYYSQYAQASGFNVTQTENGGLIRDFSVVLPEEDRGKLNPKIAQFYEHTANYKLEVWSQWYPPMSYFARILIKTVSTKMNQLNIPLYPLETSRGMSNEILHLSSADGKDVIYACWLRKSILSGKVVYAGFYSACTIEGRTYVRVVFPLPSGNVTVLLKAHVQPDGSVMLVSDGKRVGEAGYYRVRRYGSDAVKVKHVPLKESIHVFEDEYGTLRTDHKFWFMGNKMLHLHYKIIDSK